MSFQMHVSKTLTLVNYCLYGCDVKLLWSNEQSRHISEMCSKQIHLLAVFQLYFFRKAVAAK